MRLPTVLLAVAVLLPLTAAAQMYSWKDAEGKVHYADRPPTGNLPSRAIKEAPSLTGDPAGARKGLAERNMDFRKRQSDRSSSQTKAEQEQAAAEEKARNCEQARIHARNLESGQRLITTDDKGERTVLDDAGRAREMESAQKAIDAWCK
ncbi:MAG: DUF4124 domain-containing protein [Rhodocyclaceae bacterium]|nr:DUF4124 domain-containing protein [Rhodocyclaceae bacterium]